MYITIKPDQWIRVSTAAKYLDISRQAVYCRVKKRNFETIHIDEVVFVRKTDIPTIKAMLRAKNRNLRNYRKPLVMEQPI
jgi:hypothetical protein